MHTPYRHTDVKYRHASWVKGKGSTTFAVVAGPHGRQAGTKCYVLKYEGGKVSEVIQHLSRHSMTSSARSGGGGGAISGSWDTPSTLPSATGPATFASEEAQLQAALAASRADQQQQGTRQGMARLSPHGAGGSSSGGGGISPVALGAATSEQQEEMMLQQAMLASMGGAGPAVTSSWNQSPSSSVQSTRQQTSPVSEAQLQLREEQALQQALNASMRDATPTPPRAQPALKGDDLLDLFGIPPSPTGGSSLSPQAAAAAFAPTPPNGRRQPQYGASWTPPLHSYDPPPSRSPSTAAPPTATSATINFGTNQRPVYEKLWKRALLGNATRLGPNEAFALLSTSGLDNGILGSIWTLADTTQPAGSLSQ